MRHMMSATLYAHDEHMKKQKFDAEGRILRPFILKAFEKYPVNISGLTRKPARGGVDACKKGKAFDRINRIYRIRKKQKSKFLILLILYILSKFGSRN